MLTKILTYHLVPGKLSTQAIKKMTKIGHGKAELKTVGGGTLWAIEEGVRDKKGGTAAITIAKVYQSNGVIQVIHSVVLPK